MAEYEPGMFIPPPYVPPEPERTDVPVRVIDEHQKKDSIKAYLINRHTGYVLNAAVLSHLGAASPPGTFYVLPEYTTEPESADVLAIKEILAEVDPDYQDTKLQTEYPVKFGVTKWSQERKFYED